MKTPQEIHTTLTAESPSRRDEVERYIDSCITSRARMSLGWITVEIPTTRSAWPLEDISAVLKKYEEAGWQVARGSRDLMATLSYRASAN